MTRSAVLAYAETLVGLVVLLTGSMLPDDRLTLADIPLNLVPVAAALVLIAMNPGAQTYLGRALLLLAPLWLTGVTLLWSGNAEYGADKLGNLLACTLLAMPLLADAMRRVEVSGVLRLMVAVLTVLLMISVVYKVRYGFLDRSVNFLFTGPIVFARLMGLAFMASAFIYRGGTRWLACTLFALAVVWTQSKGPTLALLAMVGLLYMVKASWSQRMLGAVLMVALTCVVVAEWSKIEQLGALDRYVAAAQAASDSDADEGGVEGRMQMYKLTANLIAREPFGVGLGGWNSSIHLSWEYPHNFFLELWSEAGLILGSLAALPFLLFLFSWRSALAYAASFLFLAQQVSGDLLDARFALNFALLAFVIRHWPAAEGAQSRDGALAGSTALAHR